MGYSFRLAVRVLLYASSHRQDNTYHGLCYTSRGALAGMGNSSMGTANRCNNLQGSHHRDQIYKNKKFKNKIKGKIAPPNKTNLKSSLICWNICFDSIHFPCISKKVKLFSFFQIIKNTCTRIVILATYCNLPPNTKITFCNTNAASVFPAQDKMMHPSACTTKTIPTFKKT